VREIHDTNRKAPERVYNTKHKSRGAGKETRGSEERRKRSGIGGRVSERPEGAETVGIRGKRGEKGDIIADFGRLQHPEAMEALRSSP